jgi:hypothetical protein
MPIGLRANWSGDLEAQDLPMSTLTAGLTPAIEYRGRLSVAAQCSRRVAGSPWRAACVRILPMQSFPTAHRPAKSNSCSLAPASSPVNARAYRHRNGEVSFDAGSVGTIKGRAESARAHHAAMAEHAARG